jgi:hypothetical protein
VGSGVEDERGIDRHAIRERLRLTPSERVQRLVDEVEVWSQIRRAAGVSARGDV